MSAKKIKWRRNNLFNKCYKKIRLNVFVISHTNINCKWITDLNVTANAMKFLGENIRGNFHELTRVFMDIILMAKVIKNPK